LDCTNPTAARSAEFSAPLASSSMIIDSISVYVFAGLATAMAYVLTSIWKRSRFPGSELSSVVACFLGGTGIVAAIRLIGYALVPPSGLRALTGVDFMRPYLGLAGVVVGYVSSVAIVNRWRCALKDRAPTYPGRKRSR
jgi:hypothetical protein